MKYLAYSPSLQPTWECLCVSESLGWRSWLPGSCCWRFGGPAHETPQPKSSGTCGTYKNHNDMSLYSKSTISQLYLSSLCTGLMRRLSMLAMRPALFCILYRANFLLTITCVEMFLLMQYMLYRACSLFLTTSSVNRSLWCMTTILARYCHHYFLIAKSRG